MLASKHKAIMYTRILVSYLEMKPFKLISCVVPSRSKRLRSWWKRADSPADMNILLRHVESYSGTSETRSDGLALSIFPPTIQARQQQTSDLVPHFSLNISFLQFMPFRENFWTAYREASVDSAMRVRDGRWGEWNAEFIPRRQMLIMTPNCGSDDNIRDQHNAER